MDKKDIRLEKISIYKVLPLIGEKGCGKLTIQKEMVKADSPRLRAFKKSHECSVCGEKATHFWVEKNNNDKSFHLNLYGKYDGKEMVFTFQKRLDAVVCANCVPTLK